MGAIDSFVSTSAAERHRQRMYLSGIQALVRLPLLQRQLDRHQGLRTAGLVSGYGPVKEAAMKRYDAARTRILAGENDLVVARPAPVFLMKSV